MKKENPVFKFVIIVFLALILIIAIIQNTTAAPIHFLMLNLEIPVIALILITFFIGYLLGLLTFQFLFKKNPDKVIPEDSKKRSPQK